VCVYARVHVHVHVLVQARVQLFVRTHLVEPRRILDCGVQNEQDAIHVATVLDPIHVRLSGVVAYRDQAELSDRGNSK
jgi:hypothetical protein